MWKFFWWISIICPVVWVLWWVVKKVFLGITWPLRALWRKLRGKNKYLKELEAMERGREFHVWMADAKGTLGLSQWANAEDVLHSASGMNRDTYNKMCKQVERLFSMTGDGWGISEADDFGWK